MANVRVCMYAQSVWAYSKHSMSLYLQSVYLCIYINFIPCNSCALYQAEMSSVVNDKYCTVEKMEHSRLIDIYEGGKITHYVYNFFLDFFFSFCL